MLITSPRLKPGDTDHWDTLNNYDQRLAAHATTLEDDAVHTISTWWQGDGVCSVSWGKDSTVVAHLATLTGLPIPIVWVRSDPYEMPECEDVRDAFLNTHPDVRYEERVATLRNPKRGEPGYEAHHSDPNRKHQDVLKEHITEPYISGVRAEESAIRAKSARWHGKTTTHTCRPILHWQATDVFAYMEAAGLPVHPAYAMSYAGKLDRRWLRVHPLCSHHEESGVHGRDMATWEDDYYADAIENLRVLNRR